MAPRWSHTAGIPVPMTSESIKKRLSRLTYLPAALELAWTAARLWTIGWAVLLVVQGLIPTATVYVTKLLVDAVAEALGGGLAWTSAGPVVVLAGVMGGLMLLGEILKGLTAWVQTAQAEKLQDYVKTLVHRKAGEVDLAFYESPDYFDLMTRANEEASGRTLSLLQNLGGMVQNGITLIGVAILLLPYAVWLPLALLVSTLPALWVVLHHKKVYHDWWTETTEDRRWAQYYDRLLTFPYSAPEVRIFDLAPMLRRAYAGLRRMLRTTKIDLMWRQNLASLGAAAVGLAVTAGVMVWMGARALQGTATLGDLALFYRAFSEGRGLMRSLLSGLGSLYADALFLEHLFTFLNLEPEVTEPVAPVVLHEPADAIRFEGVRFHYPASEENALDGFDLTIPVGKTVAIVGPNGAGKSTLTKLLCRFYDPQEGRITIDGVDLSDLPLDRLRSMITVMFQYPVQYIATAADNIRMGDVHHEGRRNDVMEAARAGGAHDIIERLPHGYDTLLGKQFRGGVELSGGQWQRISLSRAFFRRAPIVVLDEPTSFMDSWAEAQWLQRFRRLVENRTAIIVTHRFTTAMKADVIHVVRDGRILESGSHAELLAAGGMYADSWHAQTSTDVVPAAEASPTAPASVANGSRSTDPLHVGARPASIHESIPQESPRSPVSNGTPTESPVSPNSSS